MNKKRFDTLLLFVFGFGFFLSLFGLVMTVKAGPVQGGETSPRIDGGPGLVQGGETSPRIDGGVVLTATLTMTPSHTFHYEVEGVDGCKIALFYDPTSDGEAADLYCLPFRPGP